DFHARQQTICCLTTEDAVTTTHELKNNNKEEVRAFYSQFQGPVLVDWKPVVTASGSNSCWKNWATRSGLGMRPRFGSAHGGGKRTIAATQRWCWTCWFTISFLAFTAKLRLVGRSCGCCVT